MRKYFSITIRTVTGMNIYRHELCAMKRAVFGWSAALALTAAVMLAMYPALGKSSEDVTEVLRQFPQSVKILLGIKNDNLGSFEGFFPYVLSMLTELGAVGGMLLGAHALRRETESKTADFLLSKPLTRSQILKHKLLAVFSGVLLIQSVFLLVILTITPVVAKGSMPSLILVSLQIFYLQLLYAAFGALLAACFPRLKMPAAIAIGSLVFYHVLYDLFFVTLGAESELYRYFIPFGFFDSDKIIASGGYETRFVLLWLFLVLVCVRLTFWFYNRRDVPSL